MSFVSILLLFVSDCSSSGGGCGGGADDIDSLGKCLVSKLVMFEITRC